MENNYRLAAITEKDELIKDITRLENELSKKLGEDIILLAYTTSSGR